MPFLRVIRDKRGYETSYLMHWFHESGRQRSRILYAFRGPGGARVGRQPLESTTMRQIEATYPDIPFDWKAVFAERQIIETAPPETRRKRPRRDDEPAARAVPPPEPAAPAPAQPAPRAPSLGIPAAIQGQTPEEKRAFLAEVYPLARERVERRTTDETRKLALLTLVERLNPDAWGAEGTDEADRLSQAAEALERLSRVLTRRRRRGGRGERPVSDTPPVTEG